VASGLTTGSLSLVLIEAGGGSVEGTGSFSGPAGAGSVEVTGVHTFPNVNLTIRSAGFENGNFTGLMDSAGQMMSGTLNGFGFVNSPVSLRRQ
jgi:hypothetical protein